MSLVLELGEDTRLLAGGLMLQLWPDACLADDLAQALVALKAEDVIDAVLLAPAISFSRRKPESALSTILTSGQLWRSCPTMRVTSSTEPGAASRLAGRSQAQSS